jgi:hypothetical protein
MLGNYNDENDDSNHTEGKNLIYNLIFISAIITTVLQFIGFIFIKNEPPTPPNATSV